MRWFLLVLVIPFLAACGDYKPKSKGEAYFIGYGCVKCHQVGSLGHAWGPDLTMICLLYTSPSPRDRG